MVGRYEDVAPNSISTEAHGIEFRILHLDDLIAAKRAAGRPKDFETIAELEVIREELRRLG